MRLSDIGDWLRLRRHLARPWEFVRSRHAPPPAPVYEIPFRDGGSVRLRDAPMDRHIFHRIFARDEYALDGVLPGAWDTVIDIGAHIGLFAVRVAPLARRVLSYEPSDENHALLVENVRRFAHVRPHRAAVAGKRGTVTLYRSDNPSAHSMFPAEHERKTGATIVDSLALADIFEEHQIDRCDLLKLDCEGAEYDVLYALPRELWPRIERLAMEFHPVAGGPAEWRGEALARYLRDIGHRVELRPSKKNPAKGLLFSIKS
ncbi:MAG: FkbM family methyltransferase [Planctomycetes bacterium]|nr:FkbM family methyltransferase [Planctomycetota bacterium]